jgi:hypothetical protein
MVVGEDADHYISQPYQLFREQVGVAQMTPSSEQAR